MDSVSNVNVALLDINLCDAISARLRELSHHVPIMLLNYSGGWNSLLDET
jgi:hypothetical protein